jgi:hypothetical protein
VMESRDVAHSAAGTITMGTWPAAPPRSTVVRAAVDREGAGAAGAAGMPVAGGAAACSEAAAASSKGNHMVSLQDADK